MPELATFVELIRRDHAQSWQGFETLRMPNIPDHPIPFFGEPNVARVLTVGVNPSWEEFTINKWPDELSNEDLEARLRHYFSAPDATPHPWFRHWSDALRHVELSYTNGVAHLDLSPRATRAMKSCPKDTFLGMVAQDIKWFFEILPYCERASVMMLAGCVTNDHYMNEYVKKKASHFGYKLLPMQDKPNTKGDGPVSYHTLVGFNRCLKVFFCGVSPSARRPRILAQRVKENSAHIKEWLK